MAAEILAAKLLREGLILPFVVSIFIFCLSSFIVVWKGR
jgi:hypothetical protein